MANQRQLNFGARHRKNGKVSRGLLRKVPYLRISTLNLKTVNGDETRRY